MPITKKMTATQTTPLQGWVATYFVNKGGRKVGPYYTRNWKRNGKLYKQYIKASDVETIRAACQANRERKKRQRALAQNFTRTIQNLNFLERIAKRSETQPLRTEDYAHIDKIEQEGFAVEGRPKLRTSIPSPHRQPATDSGDLRFTTYDLPTQTVMVPPRAKSSLNVFERLFRTQDRLMQRALTAFKQARKEERTKETTDEKWIRWRKEIAAQPKPSRPYILALPEWLTEEEVDQQIAQICKPGSKEISE